MTIAFSMNAGDLARLLTTIKGIVPTRTTIPILEHVEIATKGSQVKVRASTMEAEAEAWMPADVAEDGAIAMPGLMLHSMVSRLAKSATVNISAEPGNRATISAGRSRYQINTLPADDFPVSRPPGDGAVEIVMPAAELRRMVAMTRGSASTNESRAYLMGMHVHSERSNAGGGHRLVCVSTDGHRLVRVVADGATVPADGLPPDLIVPNDTLRHLDAILDDGDVRIITDTHRISFEVGSARLTTALVAGTYPDYQRLIPRRNGALFTSSADEIADAAERAAVVYAGSGPDNGIPRLRIGVADGRVMVRATAQSGNEAVEDVGASDTAMDGEFFVNGRYLVDAMRLWGGKLVSVQHGGGMSAILITSDADQSMTQVVMPFKW